MLEDVAAKDSREETEMSFHQDSFYCFYHWIQPVVLPGLATCLQLSPDFYLHTCYEFNIYSRLFPIMPRLLVSCVSLWCLICVEWVTLICFVWAADTQPPFTAQTNPASATVPSRDSPILFPVPQLTIQHHQHTLIYPPNPFKSTPSHSVAIHQPFNAPLVLLNPQLHFQPSWLASIHFLSTDHIRKKNWRLVDIHSPEFIFKMIWVQFSQ